MQSQRLPRRHALVASCKLARSSTDTHSMTLPLFLTDAAAILANAHRDEGQE